MNIVNSVKGQVTARRIKDAAAFNTAPVMLPTNAVAIDSMIKSLNCDNLYEVYKKYGKYIIRKGGNNGIKTGEFIKKVRV